MALDDFRMIRIDVLPFISLVDDVLVLIQEWRLPDTCTGLHPMVQLSDVFHPHRPNRSLPLFLGLKHGT